MGFFDTIGKMKDNFLQRMGKVKIKFHIKYVSEN